MADENLFLSGPWTPATDSGNKGGEWNGPQSPELLTGWSQRKRWPPRRALLQPSLPPQASLQAALAGAHFPSLLWRQALF